MNLQRLHGQICCSLLPIRDILGSMARRVKARYSQIPIIGPLVEAPRASRTAASTEFICSFGLSTMPIWFGALGLCLYSDATSFGDLLPLYFQRMKSLTMNGECFILAASLAAPVLYIVTRDRPSNSPFPSRTTFIGAVILLTLFATLTFSVQRERAAHVALAMVALSWLFLFLSSTVTYCALVYNNQYSLPDPAKQMRSSETAATEALKNHRM